MLQKSADHKSIEPASWLKRYGAQFELRPGHRPFWSRFVVVLFSTARKVTG